MTITGYEAPVLEFDEKKHEHLADAYRHDDGSITYVVWDSDGQSANPREDENLTTLINEARNYIAIDTDDAGLSDARRRWEWTDYGSVVGDALYRDPSRVDTTIYNTGAEKLMQRYVAIFRPDIVHYVHRWEFSSSQSDYHYGWGYITRERWDELMGDTPTDDAGKRFDGEVDVYRQWVAGEVYGAIHETLGEPIVELGEQGAHITGYKVDEEDCWGFLGYDDHKDICGQFTNSPVIDTLY